jgi:hypothetical protein
MFNLDGTPALENDNQQEEAHFDEVDAVLDEGGQDAGDGEGEDSPEEAQSEEVEAEDRETSGEDDDETVSQESLKALQLSLEGFERDLGILHQLHRTVSREGVSEADMATLMAIRERHLSQLDLGVEGFGFFTQERSSLSLDIAQESFTRTVLDTIKAWFKKIMEFIKSSYRFLKKHLLPQLQVNHQIDLYYRKLTLVFDAYMEMVRLNHMGGAGFPDWSKRHQEAMLKQLPQTELTLVVMGEGKHATTLQTLTEDLTPTVEHLLRESETAIDILVEGGDGMSAFAALKRPMEKLRQANETIVLLLDVSQASTFLTDNVKTNLLTTRPSKLLSSGYAYETPLKLLSRVEKNLAGFERGIKHLSTASTQADADAIVDALRGYNQSIHALVSVCKALEKACQLRLHFMKYYYGLLEQAMQYHYKGVMETAASERTKEKAESLVKTTIEKLRTMR